MSGAPLLNPPAAGQQPMAQQGIGGGVTPRQLGRAATNPSVTPPRVGPPSPPSDFTNESTDGGNDSPAGSRDINGKERQRYVVRTEGRC
ncbi:unnamed protein product [Linum trigynum]|uniref:Uncharacterized protein n=1 Tax=Linum trigynum TaxID=586398 RepID=A0AAV2CC62_9ROSI